VFDAEDGHLAEETGAMDRSTDDAEFRQLLDALPESLLVVEQGAIVYANAAASALIQAARPALVGQQAATVLGKEGWAACLAEARRCEERTYAPSPIALTLHREQSTTLSLEAECRPVGGRRRAYVVILRECREAADQARALAQAEQRYARLLASCPDAIYVHQAGRILFANEAAALLLGVESPEQLVGRGVLNHVHPDHRELVEQRIREATEEGRVATAVVERLRTYDGRDVYVQIHSAAIMYDDQPAVQVVLHDATDRVESERAMRESEDRYRQLVESSPDAIYVHSKGKIVFANAAAASLLGLKSAQELLGHHVLDHVHPDYRESVARQMRRSTEQGTIRPYSVERLRRYDGRDLYVHIRSSLVRYDGASAVQIVLRDMSEFVRAQEDLKRRDAILAAVGDAAENLLRAPHWRGCIDSVLASLGRAADVSRVYLLERDTGAPESAALLSTHEWVSAEMTRRTESSAAGASGAWRVDVRHWTRRFEQGEILCGRTAEFPADDQDLLSERGVLSFVYMPITVDGEWWGLIGFDDCLTEREWPPAEQDALRTAAGAISAAIERERRETQLVRTETRLREVLDHTGDAVYRLDLDAMGFAYVTPSIRDLTGYEPSAFLSCSIGWFEGRIHPDDRDRLCLERLGLAQGTLESVSPFVEYRWRHRDGTYRWHGASRTVVRDGAGKPVALVGAVRDMTARKQTMDRLRESDERFRAVFEANRDSIIVTNTQGQIVFANRAALALARRERGEILGTPVNEAFSRFPERAQVWASRISSVLETAESIEMSEHYHRMGSEVYAESTVLPLTRAGGGVFGTVAIFRDVTERKHRELALHESEERFRALFENIGDAFVLFDKDLNVLLCDDPNGILFGERHGEIDDSRIKRVLQRLEMPQTDVASVLIRARDTWEPQRYQGVCLRRTREGREESTYLDTVAYGVPIQGQRCVALLCRDVSQNRTLEDALRRSQRMEALGRLSYGVAHDFGNVLTVVQGECELLETMLEPDSPAMRELEVIGSMVDNGASIARQLIAFSRGQTVEDDVLHLNKVLEDHLDLLNSIVGPEHDLDVSLCAEPVYFWCAEGEFTRVIMNIILNARDAMPDGGTVHLATRRTLLDEEGGHRVGVPPGLYAEVCVRDTGRGIARENRERIFEPYFTTEPTGHSGLGLSVAYGIVTRHGGQITVDSEPGKGSTFSVFLPAIRDEELADDA